MASSEGHIEVVRLLLDRGADIQAQTKVSESLSVSVSGHRSADVVSM
jgi:hypothetical protein